MQVLNTDVCQKPDMAHAHKLYKSLFFIYFSTRYEYEIKHTDNIAYSYLDNIYYCGIVHAWLKSTFISNIAEITKKNTLPI